MQLDASETQLYYHVLDLDDDEKQRYLERLQHTQPERYQRLIRLVLADEASEKPLTELLYFAAEQATTHNDNLSGQVVNKYRLTHELGRGGMGVVYAAQRADDTFEQHLAIKFIQNNLSNVLGRRALFDEAQLLARLNHPYIAKVFDGGVYHDSVYIVMEHVFGTTLNHYLQATKPSASEKLRLFKQICQAMEHAHQHQVLHADLKPENILIDHSKNPKLLDFNLTQRAYNDHSTPSLALLAFSENFASPEQKSGQTLTVQSDIYSLGKILSLMFPSLTLWSDVYWVIRRATRANTQKRYSNVTALKRDIERILERRPIAQKKHCPFYRTLRLVQRRPLASILSSVLLLSGLLFTHAIVQKNTQLQQEKKVAEDMMYEITRLIFHAKGQNLEQMSVSAMMELTRRRILSNPDIPKEIKQKMLLAMMTPVEDKQVTKNKACQVNCVSGYRTQG